MIWNYNNFIKTSYMSKAFVKGIHDVTPIWQLEILWALLAEGKDNDNSFSIM